MIALYLDTETTGLDPSTHALAEVCGVLAHVPDGGKARVLRAWSSLVQVGDAPMDDDVRRITGLTPELCNDHGVPVAVAVETLRRMAVKADCVVAWNAPFDRAFLEAAGLVVTCPWVDAQRNVDWKAEGASRESLVVVAAEVGRMVNPCPHAALGDVLTMLAVMAPRMRDAVEDAKVPHVWLSVVHSPHGSNDALKELDYRWDGRRRVWERQVKTAELGTERARLPAGCSAWHSTDPLPEAQLVSIEVTCPKDANETVARWLSTRWDPERRVKVAEKVRTDYAQVAVEELSEFGIGCRIIATGP